jgi:hypothetical protein
MKLENLSFRQVALGVLVLGFLTWAGLQFAILPSMPAEERKQLYSGWPSTPYPYFVGIAFICFAVWFVFSYNGSLATHGRKIVVFAMALGSLGGMLMILAIRLAWHL